MSCIASSTPSVYPAAPVIARRPGLLGGWYNQVFRGMKRRKITGSQTGRGFLAGGPAGHGNTHPPDPVHEAKCKRCGRCCLTKIQVWDKRTGKLYGKLTGQHCPYWDPVSKLCTVYDRRKEVWPGCLSVNQAIEQSILPNDCPYVKGKIGYRCAIIDFEPKKGKR